MCLYVDLVIGPLMEFCLNKSGAFAMYSRSDDVAIERTSCIRNADYRTWSIVQK